MVDDLTKVLANAGKASVGLRSLSTVIVMATLVQSGCSEHVKSSETGAARCWFGCGSSHRRSRPARWRGQLNPVLDEVCSAGTLSEAGAEPVQGRASQLALGNEHSCARLEGEVWCWGNNRNGELGNGDTIARGHPIRVQQLSAVSGVYSGDGFEICGGTRGSHTCALLPANGNVSCWGANVEGKASMEDAKPTLLPMLIPALSNVVQLGVGGYGNCAVLGDGTTRCWGEDVGCGQDGGVDGFLVSFFAMALRLGEFEVMGRASVFGSPSAMGLSGDGCVT